MLMDFARAIEGGVNNRFVTEYWWLWPIMEIIHFIGLSLLLGALLVIDLRTCGLFRKVDIAAIRRLLPVAFLGFGLNLIECHQNTSNPFAASPRSFSFAASPSR